MNSRNILIIAVLCLYHSGMFAQTAAVQPGKDLSPRYVLVDGALWEEQYMDIMKRECEDYLPIPLGGYDMASVEPYLVDISESGAEHINKRVKQDPVNLRVTRLHSKLSLGALRSHLRRFIRVTTDTGKSVFFRFWDPYAVNSVFPNLSQYPFISEKFVADFFAPVEYLITEDTRTNERRIYYLSADKKLQIKIEAIENADDE